MPGLVQIPTSLKAEVTALVAKDSSAERSSTNDYTLTNQNTEKLSQVCELISSRADKSLFNLDIEDFDGPIDLLLHLVKRNELPIEKLSLAKVADQFLSCVKQADMYDLEIAGEYLVIAANLLSIKASLLVDPKAVVELENDDGPDPHAELLQRLRAAAVYQQAAGAIAARNLLGVDVFAPAFKYVMTKTATPAEEPLAKHDVSLIFKAWNRVLQKMPVQRPQMVINWARVSVTDKMKIFVEKLNQQPQKRFLFEELLEISDDLPHLVSSFVAILELCKRQIVFVAQDSFEENIFISLRGDQTSDIIAERLGMERSEFDFSAAELAASEQDASKAAGNV